MAAITACASLGAWVPSESTEGRDRLEKWIAYRSLPSLREYLLIAQDRPLLEVLRRREDGWDQIIFEGGDTVDLDAVKAAFPLDSLYADGAG